MAEIYKKNNYTYVFSLLYTQLLSFSAAYRAFKSISIVTYDAFSAEKLHGAPQMSL